MQNEEEVHLQLLLGDFGLHDFARLGIVARPQPLFKCRLYGVTIRITSLNIQPGDRGGSNSNLSGKHPWHTSDGRTIGMPPLLKTAIAHHDLPRSHSIPIISKRKCTKHLILLSSPMRPTKYPLFVVDTIQF